MSTHVQSMSGDGLRERVDGESSLAREPGHPHDGGCRPRGHRLRVTVGRYDQPTTGPQHARHGLDGPVEIGHQVEHIGGDDGIEFIDADLLVPSFNRSFGITHLGIQLTENDISLSLITR